MCYRREMQPLARLARASVLLLPWLSGCLYIGHLNHPPQIEAVSVGESNLVRCGRITLKVVASDPDGDTLGYRWSVRVESTEPAAPGQFALLRMVSSACDGLAGSHDLIGIGAGSRSSATLSEGATLSLEKLPLRGRYLVTVEVFDTDGSTRSAEHRFEIPNQAPTIGELRLERDPEHAEDNVPELGDRFPAHAHYRAWVLKVDDPESDLRCGSSPEPSWELVSPSVAPLRFLPLPCKPGEPDELRFQLPAEAVTTATSLTLRVSYDDGQGGKTSSDVTVTAYPNRPPCIEALGVQPPTSASLADKPVPVVHELGRVFDVSLVNDDVPLGVTFTWLIRDAGSSGFSVVQGQSGPVFTVPAWFRPAGHQLELRALVSEQSVTAEPCSESEPLCRLPERYDPKKLLGECYAWVTWRLSFI